jgi:hypothetical protein
MLFHLFLLPVNLTLFIIALRPHAAAPLHVMPATSFKTEERQKE